MHPPEPRGADQRQHLVAAALHVLLRDERLEAQAQQRLGVRGPHVEVPVVVVDRDAVEGVLAGVGVALGDLGELRLLVGDLAVDLAGDEVALAVGREQRRERPALARAELEHQQRRDRARVGAVEVVEVVVAGDLAAEQRALRAHPRLEEGVPDAVAERAAAGRGDRVRRRRGSRARRRGSPRPGWCAAATRASSAVTKSPATNSPCSSMKKQRSASPSNAMPRSAPLSRTRRRSARGSRRASGWARGRGSRGSASSWTSSTLDVERLEDRADRRAGHAHASRRRRRAGRGSRPASTKRSAAARNSSPTSTASTPPPPGGRRQAGRRPARGCGRCRRRPRAPGRPRAGASRPCSPSGCARRCRRARRRARARRRGSRRPRSRPAPASSTWTPSATSPVAVAGASSSAAPSRMSWPSADAQLGRRLALELGERAGERAPDLLGEVAVDLLAVDAADVVGLEDRGVDASRRPSYALARPCWTRTS